MDRPGPVRLSLFLTVGIAAVSCGAVLVRLAAAPALVVAAYRVSWAICLLAPLVMIGPMREFRTYNWSPRWLTPGLVALIGLSEPLGASLLANFFLNEGLAAGKGLGGCLILAGIHLATSRNIGK